MRSTRRLCIYLGWISIAVVLFASCRSEGGEPLTPTPSEALRKDAEAYAQQYGITVEEAVERLQYQDGIGDLNAALQANEADTFGGLWIEHEPEYRVVVLFTRDGEKTLRPYIQNKSFAHLVEVRGARYTLAQLETIQIQAMRELEKLDFGVHTFLAVQDNRIEVPVSDRAWFEGELRRVGARPPKGVEVVVIEGGSTARDKDLLLTPPVPGIAFPRQKPIEGIRESMLAELIGTLWLEGACLNVHVLDGGVVLPIWPPEYTLRVEEDQVLAIDSQGQVAARVGEEVYMGGGHVGVTDEWVLQQIPDACRGEYFVVGNEVRPNLRYDSELFSLDVISDVLRPPDTVGTVLFLRYKPTLDEQAVEEMSISGKLTAYGYRRCLLLQTDRGPGEVMLLWPTDWSVRVDDGTVIILDATGQAVARMGDEVRLRGQKIPESADVELPGDCIGTSWLVDGVD